MINLKNILLGIAIFFLTLFVGMYGINTFYGKAPQYNDYCPVNSANTFSECINLNGTWINNTQTQNTLKEIPPKPITESGYCQYDYTRCQKQLETAQEKYYKGVFYIALPLGIILMAIGLLLFNLAPVGTGLMAGGIALVIFGSESYWRFAGDLIKFLLSLAGLIAVIILAYYFNNRFRKK